MLRLIVLLLTLSMPLTAWAQAKEVVIFNNWNKAAVSNQPTAQAHFTVNQAVRITSISNYHWNNGRGAPPGQIGLRGPGGKTYGPWTAQGTSGTGGAQNVNWVVKPNVELPPGTYQIWDSSVATWSQNSGSGGAGFAQVSAVPLAASQSSAQSSPGQQAKGNLKETKFVTSNYFGNQLFLSRDGNRITGRYPPKGKVEGTLNGAVMTGTWSDGNSGGALEIRFNADMTAFEGKLKNAWSRESYPFTGRKAN